MNSLRVASIFTISIIFSFVFFIVISIGLISENLSIFWAIAITILVNFILWVIGPFISDLIYRWLYKVKFYTRQEFAAGFPEIYEFMNSVCVKYKFNFPKIGVIDDRNPTAFTYGSTRNNARVIFTEGITYYLTPEEVKTVLAHELGHIYHYDFIIMSIVVTFVQILYELYVFLSRSSGKSRDKKSGKLYIIGLVSYFLYWISSYLILYLSRVREYYADSFAALVTGNPHGLIQALVKVAYGIVQAEDSKGTKNLLESTRSLGIIDVKNAGFIGSIYTVSADPNTVAEVMAFDNLSPWAFVLEFSSTHPLTGKRIAALENMAVKLGQTKMIDFEAAFVRINIDRARLYNGFAIQLLIYILPYLLPIFGLVMLNIGGAVLFFAIGLLIRLNFQLNEKKAASSDILTEMKNPYASPLIGKPVLFDGKIVGRGVPGFVFSEDMMFQDNTGLIYLNYNSIFGFIGNIFFALGKVKEMMGESVRAEGWFFRGITQSITLRKIYRQNGTISSHPKLVVVVMATILAFVGALLISLFMVKRI